MAKRDRKKFTGKPELIGRRLLEAMTREQVVLLLDTLLGSLDAQRKEALLAAVTEEMAETISRVLDPAQTPSDRETTDSRFEENWAEAWGRFNICLFELGEEEGKYVDQEEEWEPPYFDGYTLSEDLDEISQDILPLLERAHGLGLEADGFFEEEFCEIEHGIRGYPDWMGAEHSDCVLGPVTTKCFLRWEWLTAAAHGLPVADFVERVAAVQDALEIIDLDGRALADFFASLPRDIQKEAFEHIRAGKNSPEWQERLEMRYRIWYDVYHELSEAFDPEEYLADCVEHLREDWRLGLPPIEALLEKREYVRAEPLIERTFASLMRRLPEGTWSPEDELLAAQISHLPGEDRELVVKLLGFWGTAAKKAGKADRAAILALQSAAFRSPFHWDRVVKAYKKLADTPCGQIAGKLLSQWKRLMSQKSVPSYISGVHIRGERLEDSWIHWLIETQTEDRKDARWFSERIQNWLASLARAAGRGAPPPAEPTCLLHTLTADIGNVTAFGDSFPRLLAVVSGERESAGKCSVSRRKCLARMEVEEIARALSVFWRENIAAFVPEPSAASSYGYSQCAKWVMAAEELNPAAFAEIISRWQAEHKRKRNLWRDLRQAGYAG